MNKISPFVVMFSKSYGHFGTLRSSYNILQISNRCKTNNYFVNNYDNKYRAISIPIRYFSAQPKKQSTSFSEYDQTKIQCKNQDKNDSTGNAPISNQKVPSTNDIPKINETAGILTPGEIKPSKDQGIPTETVIDPVDQKPDGLFKKFKKMYKEYWYVLLPVHVVTSAFWFGSFYYVSHSGVDIPALMESVGLSEFYIKPLRDSKLGHVAIAYLLYKVATPLRYTVTLGGTTFSIKYLVKRGYIKPVPTKDELIKKYKNRMVVRRDSKN